MQGIPPFLRFPSPKRGGALFCMVSAIKTVAAIHREGLVIGLTRNVCGRDCPEIRSELLGALTMQKMQRAEFSIYLVPRNDQYIHLHFGRVEPANS
jgi:hypothetical protein